VQETGKAMDDVLDGDNSDNGNNNSNTNSNNNTNTSNRNSSVTGNSLLSTASQKDRITIYSKADWVAGEDLILFEDFSKDAVGDFPQLWNTNSSGEVITLSNKPETKWLKMYNSATYQPDYLKNCRRILQLNLM
jgi:hypothetical protein